VKGNMAWLMRLARSPYPLPVGGLTAQRSLLALDNLIAAIVCVLAAPGSLRRPLIVADPQPLTLPDMITAMRRGLGRRPGLITVPALLVEAAFRAAGRSDIHQRVAGPLVANPAALGRLGLVPAVSTAAGLERLMQSCTPEGHGQERT
jgi:nucleoside-diphosphate-sugar epimerase